MSKRNLGSNWPKTGLPSERETEKPSSWMAFLCDGQSLASLKSPLP
jgi:hypothetical protein